jgi:hypothetical protein
VRLQMLPPPSTSLTIATIIEALRLNLFGFRQKRGLRTPGIYKTATIFEPFRCHDCSR